MMLALSGVEGQPDPWGFDEAPVETWADILRPQYLDLALLAAFIVLAMISFKKKSVPLKFVTFAFAIGYMGFAKSYLISITNIFSVLDWNLPVFKHNLAWYLFAGFTVVSTILWGHWESAELRRKGGSAFRTKRRIEPRS